MWNIAPMCKKPVKKNFVMSFFTGFYKMTIHKFNLAHNELFVAPISFLVDFHTAARSGAKCTVVSADNHK